MPDLIKNGHVYLAVPPLFRVTTAKEVFYCATDKEVEALTATLKQKRTTYQIGRFKGLGEMSAKDMGQTLMSPEHRILKQINIHDLSYTTHVIQVLMGEDSEQRKDFLRSGGEIA